MNVVFGRLGVASCQWHRVSSTVDNAYAFSAGKIIFFFEKRKKKSIFSRYVVFPLQTVASERWKRVIKYIYFKKLRENRFKDWRMLEEKDNEISDYFRSNFHRLQNAITPQDMKKFVSLNSNSERIDFMLRYPQVYDLAIKIGEVEDQMLKNGEKALKLKDVGNKYFGRGEFIKALEIYSNAVLLAPQKGNC